MLMDMPIFAPVSLWCCATTIDRAEKGARYATRLPRRYATQLSCHVMREKSKQRKLRPKVSQGCVTFPLLLARYGELASEKDEMGCAGMPQGWGGRLTRAVETGGARWAWGRRLLTFDHVKVGRNGDADEVADGAIEVC